MKKITILSLSVLLFFTCESKNSSLRLAPFTSKPSLGLVHGQKISCANLRSEIICGKEAGLECGKSKSPISELGEYKRCQGEKLKLTQIFFHSGNRHHFLLQNRSSDKKPWDPWVESDSIYTEIQDFIPPEEEEFSIDAQYQVDNWGKYNWKAWENDIIEYPAAKKGSQKAPPESITWGDGTLKEVGNCSYKEFDFEVYKTGCKIKLRILIQGISETKEEKKDGDETKNKNNFIPNGFKKIKSKDEYYRENKGKK